MSKAEIVVSLIGGKLSSKYLETLRVVELHWKETGWVQLNY